MTPCFDLFKRKVGTEGVIAHSLYIHDFIHLIQYIGIRQVIPDQVQTSTGYLVDVRVIILFGFWRDIITKFSMHQLYTGLLFY